MSIRVKYEKELKDLQDKLLYMCRKVQEAIKNSVIALETGDTQLAEEVVKNDKKINKLENEIEHDCLRIMLMESPVASDFRELSASLKMITDLERIGDQASDIANISTQITGDKKLLDLKSIKEMAVIVQEMVTQGVNAYINKDIKKAKKLAERDKLINKLFDKVKQDVVKMIKEDTANTDNAMLLMMIAKYFERIGDHSVNIGEWVEFVSTGKRQ